MQPSNKGLLTAREKITAFANYPCLDPSFEDDYTSEVTTLLQAQREKTLRQVGRRLKHIREDSYDQATFEHDSADFIKFALKGKLLPMPRIIKVGTIFANPKFNEKYANPHPYEHSSGYPDNEYICICGEPENNFIHHVKE